MNEDFNPNDVKSWQLIVHNAAKIPQNDPRYPEAQRWSRLAIHNIASLEHGSNVADQREARDMGPGVAAAMGLARGMSMGASDLFTPYTNTESQQAASDVTNDQHKTAHLVGEVAGAAVPFVAGAGLARAGMMVPGAATGLGARTAIGTAQGFGLSRGGVSDRIPGAILGGALAAGAPYIPKVAGAVMRPVRGLTRIVNALSKVGDEASSAGRSGRWANQALEGERPYLAETDANLMEQRAIEGDTRAVTEINRRGEQAREVLARPRATPGKPISEGPPGSSAHVGETSTPSPMESVTPGTRGRVQRSPSAETIARRNAMLGIKVKGQSVPAVPLPDAKIQEVRQILSAEPNPASQLRLRTILADHGEFARRLIAMKVSHGDAAAGWSEIVK